LEKIDFWSDQGPMAAHSATQHRKSCTSNANQPKVKIRENWKSLILSSKIFYVRTLVLTSGRAQRGLK